MKRIRKFLQENKRLTLIISVLFCLIIFNIYIFYDIYILQELQSRDNSTILANAKHRALIETDPLIKEMWSGFAYEIEYKYPKEIKRDIQQDWTIIYASNTIGFLIILSLYFIGKTRD